MINKKKLFFLLRLSVSVLLIFFIVVKVDFQKVLALVPGIKLRYVLLSLLWLLLDRLVMSYRWAILLKAKDIKISLFDIVKIYFVSSFWSTFLPSSVAPDIIKVYVASKHNSNTPDVMSSVVVDRIIGLFSLSLVALTSLLILMYYPHVQSVEGYRGALWVILAVLLLTLFLPFFDRVPVERAKGILTLFRLNFLWNFLVRFYDSMVGYKAKRASLLKAFSVALVNHVLAIFMIYVLSLSLGVGVSVLHLFILVPLINFLIMVPISVGGLGIQEGAYVYFLSQLGMSVQEALTVAIVFRVLMVVVSLPGGVVYISEGFGVKKAST
jgi:uncharacterized protein (TIRG00374 family)